MYWIVGPIESCKYKEALGYGLRCVIRMKYQKDGCNEKRPVRATETSQSTIRVRSSDTGQYDGFFSNYPIKVLTSYEKSVTSSKWRKAGQKSSLNALGCALCDSFCKNLCSSQTDSIEEQDKNIRVQLGKRMLETLKINLNNRKLLRMLLRMSRIEIFEKDIGYSIFYMLLKYFGPMFWIFVSIDKKCHEMWSSLQITMYYIADWICLLRFD